MKKTLISCVLTSLAGILLLPTSIGLAMPGRTLSDRPAEPSGTLVAQVTATPLYGCWELTYNISGVVYEGMLGMDGYGGVLVTRYYNLRTRQTESVKQSMRLTDSPRGILLLGSNPAYLRSGRPHPDYQTDNLLFRVRPGGDFLALNCKDDGKCSPVEVGACPKR